MSVETWDGRTKFNVEESSREETERLDQWEKYLEGEEEGEGVTQWDSKNTNNIFVRKMYHHELISECITAITVS